MTNLWPRQECRHTDSEAEKMVFEALKTGLPKGWQAWHSLRLRSRQTGQFDETDFVIADPGKPALLLLEVKGGRIEVSDGRWYQNGHPMSSPPLNQALAFNLNKPYRCHPAIQHLDECYSGNCEPDRQILRKGLKEDVIRIVTSSEGRLLKQIGKEINRLLSGGLKPADIAVLSLRGRGSKEGITYQKEIGGRSVVLATDPKADENIICDTFLRFKGLERPAVIVTDLRLVSDLYEKRMHIAISRALSLLRIVGVEGEIRKDRILAGLI